jgi:hypothetical protein
MFIKSLGLAAGLCYLTLGFNAGSTAAAQSMKPPKVLLIDVEYLKPTTTTAAHQKSESVFVKQAQQAKTPEHWLAMSALTGQPRALFVFGYDSLAEYQKQHIDLLAQQPEFGASIDQALGEDGQLLSSAEAALYRYRDDLSHEQGADIGKMRYMEISRVQLRPGHGPEWEAYLKMLQAALDKFEPQRHLAVFQSLYGRENGGVWLLLIPLKSLEEADALADSRESLPKKMGEADATKFRGLAAASIDHSQRNLFAFDPAMSYASEEVSKSDPAFWNKK